MCVCVRAYIYSQLYSYIYIYIHLYIDTYTHRYIQGENVSACHTLGNERVDTLLAALHTQLARDFAEVYAKVGPMQVGGSMHAL